MYCYPDLKSPTPQDNANVLKAFQRVGRAKRNKVIPTSIALVKKYATKLGVLQVVERFQAKTYPRFQDRI
jgi:hypothetical protein